MISVLIPVYNTDVRTLVTSLKVQLEKALVPFEILLLDDASIPFYLELNRQLVGTTCCHYRERTINKGRLETRKELAELANYTWLLFIDADCSISGDYYIENYKPLLNKDYDVIVGGTSYTIHQPEDCNLRLHWKYAQERISTYTTRPKKNPYKGFLFNNVLFRKNLFNELNFPDAFTGYGHEDTWIGIALEQRKARLYFTDNPVLHPQLDNAAGFLQKNYDALINIKYLQSFIQTSILRQHITIFRYHQFLKKFKLMNFYALLLRPWKKKMEKNVVGCHPSLLYFDLLRLYHLNQLN